MTPRAFSTISRASAASSNARIFIFRLPQGARRCSRSPDWPSFHAPGMAPPGVGRSLASKRGGMLRPCW
eukprot:13050513-Alexandrium_andersonii.AAC.1